MIKKVTCEKQLHKIIYLLQRIEPIEYITVEHIKLDFENENLYGIIGEGNDVLAIASLVWENDFDMFYIKRLKVFKEGFGYGNSMVNYLSSIHIPVAITPFESNTAVIKIIDKLGFDYKYTFLDYYQLYIKDS